MIWALKGKFDDRYDDAVGEADTYDYGRTE